jgi:hypothetical protein
MEGYQDKSDAKENIERMAMEHFKMEAALETSNKWNVTSVPLLLWRSKLKRASQECDNTPCRCRQRFQEEEEVQQVVRSSSFPKRIAHTAMSFVSLTFSHSNDDGLKGSTVARRAHETTIAVKRCLYPSRCGGWSRDCVPRCSYINEQRYKRAVTLAVISFASFI